MLAILLLAAIVLIVVSVVRNCPDLLANDEPCCPDQILSEDDLAELNQRTAPTPPQDQVVVVRLRKSGQTGASKGIPMTTRPKVSAVPEFTHGQKIPLPPGFSSTSLA